MLMNFRSTLVDNPEEHIFVFFSPEPSVTTKVVRQLVDVLEMQGIRRGIIVWSEKMSPAAKKVSNNILARFTRVGEEGRCGTKGARQAGWRRVELLDLWSLPS